MKKFIHVTDSTDTNEGIDNNKKPTKNILYDEYTIRINWQSLRNDRAKKRRGMRGGGGGQATNNTT